MLIALVGRACPRNQHSSSNTHQLTNNLDLSQYPSRINQTPCTKRERSACRWNNDDKAVATNISHEFAQRSCCTQLVAPAFEFWNECAQQSNTERDSISNVVAIARRHDDLLKHEKSHVDWMVTHRHA
jgi:hypothetical protein